MEEKDLNNQQNPAAPEASGELDVCKKERDEYLNGWKRAKADLINYKKDEGRRFEDVVKFGLNALINDFLPVLDSFELAAGSIKGDSAEKKGLMLIQGQFLDVLRKRGVERIPVKPGDEFNSLVHEAVGEVELDPNDSKQSAFSGKIFEELSPGYTYNGKVIRAVKVRLGKVNS